MRKPRVYWRYNRKLSRGFWMVDGMPLRTSVEELALWRKAHIEVTKANHELPWVEQIESRVAGRQHWTGAH